MTHPPGDWRRRALEARGVAFSGEQGVGGIFPGTNGPFADWQAWASSLWRPHGSRSGRCRANYIRFRGRRQVSTAQAAGRDGGTAGDCRERCCSGLGLADNGRLGTRGGFNVQGSDGGQPPNSHRQGESGVDEPALSGPSCCVNSWPLGGLGSSLSARASSVGKASALAPWASLRSRARSDRPAPSRRDRMERKRSSAPLSPVVGQQSPFWLGLARTT